MRHRNLSNLLSSQSVSHSPTHGWSWFHNYECAYWCMQAHVRVCMCACVLAPDRDLSALLSAPRVVVLIGAAQSRYKTKWYRDCRSIVSTPMRIERGQTTRELTDRFTFVWKREKSNCLLFTSFTVDLHHPVGECLFPCMVPIISILT